MICTHLRIARKARSIRLCIGACVTLGVAALLLSTLATDCGAESVRHQGVPAGGRVSSSAHLDFRIVVLPSMALSVQSTGWRAQGNSCATTLQRGATSAADGRLPGRAVPLPATADGELITIAAP